jgi:hypothetical protein
MLRKTVACVGLLLSPAAWSVEMTETLKPPVAAIKPHVVKSPHGDRVDEYYWLRDDTRTNPEVLAYLAAENAHKDVMLAHVRPLEDRLYAEIVGRIKQDDSSVPYRERGYWYYRRFDAGQDYPVHARRAGSLEAPEEILLDLEQLARGRDFYEVGEFEVSPDDRLLAYAEDTVGRRQYTLRFKSLVTGELLPDVVPNVEEGVAWAALRLRKSASVRTTLPTAAVILERREGTARAWAASPWSGCGVRACGTTWACRTWRRLPWCVKRTETAAVLSAGRSTSTS